MAEKILILDDDEGILKALSDALKLEEFVVEVAGDGETGLSIAKTFLPDWVVVDCLMPQIDGVTFLNMIRGDNALRNTKIIMMSAVFTDRAFIKDTMENYSPEAFLEKPFDIESLIKIIKGKGDYSNTNSDMKSFKRSGGLDEINFIKLVYFIAAKKMTGVLTITEKKTKRTLYFYQGYLVKTLSNVENEYFGNVAVLLGLISEKNKEACISEAANVGKRVGDIMVKKGQMNKEAILEILKIQAEMRFDSLVLSNISGTYLYQPAVVNKTPKIYLKLDPIKYVLSKLLRKNSAFFVHNIKPFLELKPVLNRDLKVSGKRLCFEPWHRPVLSLINGKNKVSTIVEELRGNMNNVLRYLQGLYHFEAISYPGNDENLNRIFEAPMILKRIKNSNYFDILGVSVKSSDKDIKNAFKKLSKEYHPDRNINLDIESRVIFKEIFHTISNAYSALSNEKKRNEYYENIKNNPTNLSVDEAFVNEDNFSKGLKYFKKDMINEALNFFRKAYEADADNIDYSSYYSYMLLLKSQLEGNKNVEEPSRIIKKNLSIFSKHEISNLVAGYISKFVGKTDEALHYFNKVVEVNPESLDAKREIKILSVRKSSKAIFSSIKK